MNKAVAAPWWYIADGVKKGPIAFEELRHLLESAVVSRASLVK